MQVTDLIIASLFHMKDYSMVIIVVARWSYRVVVLTVEIEIPKCLGISIRS